MSKEDMINEMDKSIAEELIINEKRKPACEEKTSIGRKMFYCREILRFTRKEMAEFLEISPSTLSNYEKDVSSPPLKLLLMYSRYFDIPMEDFVDDFFTIEEFTLKYYIFHFINFKT
ncbi:MAG: helix-turn-helix domain-containing protein, partial [Eubacterium sp.]|nr:helix-turn-helix domain-containing protein [Eubacterium sp.]